MIFQKKLSDDHENHEATKIRMRLLKLKGFWIWWGASKIILLWKVKLKVQNFKLGLTFIDIKWIRFWKQVINKFYKTFGTFGTSRGIIDIHLPSREATAETRNHLMLVTRHSSDAKFMKQFLKMAGIVAIWKGSSFKF